MTSLSRRDREAIFGKVCRLVENKHFNPKLNGVDSDSVLEARRDRILRIENPEEFEKEMHELVSQSKTSHTGFFHKSARRIPARFAINATFQRCQASDRERRMFSAPLRRILIPSSSCSAGTSSRPEPPRYPRFPEKTLDNALAMR